MRPNGILALMLIVWLAFCFLILQFLLWFMDQLFKKFWILLPSNESVLASSWLMPWNNVGKKKREKNYFWWSASLLFHSSPVFLTRVSLCLLCYILFLGLCVENLKISILLLQILIFTICVPYKSTLDLAVFGQCDDEPLNKSHLLVAFARMLTFVRQV